MGGSASVFTEDEMQIYEVRQSTQLYVICIAHLLARLVEQQLY